MRRDSATFYLLTALIPYTSANIALSFVPSRFFNELSRRQKIRPQTLRNSYNRALAHDFISIDVAGAPRLTHRGQRELAPFQAKFLTHAEIMLIFDIPETLRAKRQALRSTLKEFQFRQVQKSVWVSSVDCQQYILETVKDLDLSKYVILYEARRITNKS